MSADEARTLWGRWIDLWNDLFGIVYPPNVRRTLAIRLCSVGEKSAPEMLSVPATRAKLGCQIVQLTIGSESREASRSRLARRMERRGLEPLAFCMPCRCSPS